MRYIPTYCVRENLTLAKSILGANGEVLLREGVKLNRMYLRRLSKLGIPGVYISDELSEDLEIADVLSEEMRVKVVSGVKNTFSNVLKQKAADTGDTAAFEIISLATDIVDELLRTNTLVINLVDIKIYDDYTFFHSLQVTILSLIIGMGFGYNHSELVKLATSALLHDVGKVFVPEEIINKKGPLTPAEYDEVKTHSKNGYDYLLKHCKVVETSAAGVLDHHERYDGSGYPYGKMGNNISEFGRIIAAADVYDALTSDRSYRKGVFAAEAMEYIMGNSGSMFDPDVALVMSRKVALFPLGTCVLLSSGATGLVMENFENFGQRPKLKIFLENDMSVEPYLLDLCNDPESLDITIIAKVDI